MVGVIGLGKIGANVARRLAAQGFAVVGFDGDPQVRAAAEATLAVAASADEVLEAAEVVLTAVGTARDLLGDVFAPRRLGRLSGRVVVATETVSPAASRTLAGRLRQAGADYLEVRLLGTTEAARSGQLYVLAAGPRAAFERARPILAALGREVVHLGEEEGRAASLKAVANMFLHSVVVALAETVATGQALGLTEAELAGALEALPFASPLLRQALPAMWEGRYVPHLSALHAAKDLAIAAALAEGAGVRVRVAEAALEAHHRAADLGLGHEDHFAVADALVPGRTPI